MRNASLENKIVSLGATVAPRVSLADLEDNIANIEIVKHVTISGQVLRWAVITAKNGFAVVGKPSASASSANDKAEVGEARAIEFSKNELWALMGYALKQSILENSSE